MKYLLKIKSALYSLFFGPKKARKESQQVPQWNDAEKVYKKIEELRALKAKQRAFPNYENELRKSYSAFVMVGDTVIDIGAHNGIHTNILSVLVGETGSVFGFEPLPKQFAQLKETFSARKNVTLVNKALSDKVGSFDFFEVDGSPEESGLLTRINYNNPSKARPHKIKVSVDKLDDYIDRFSRIDFVKLDAEGSEMHILDGAKKVLAKYRPIISIEWGHVTYHLDGYTKDTLFQFTTSNGYCISDLWGNIMTDIKVWRDACDSVYWDFFLVPQEKVASFKKRVSCHRENTEMEFSTVRQFLFPLFPLSRDICERRRDFLKDFSISPDYHLAVLVYINENFDLKGKRVLELGGSNIPREILLDDFGVKQYVGIDYIESWWPDPNHKRETVNQLADLKKVYSPDKPYLIFSGNVDDLPSDLLRERFDIIISFSSIEHFDNIPLMLKNAHSVLKKGGLYFATSEPLWSSGKGHHFWIDAGYNFQVTNDFDFMHLLYDKEGFLKKFSQKKDIEKVAEQIYDWKGINRAFYKDIEDAVYSSDFLNKAIYPFIIQDPPADILDALRSRHSGRIKSDKDFSIRGIQWVLEK